MLTCLHALSWTQNDKIRLKHISYNFPYGFIGLGLKLDHRSKSNMNFHFLLSSSCSYTEKSRLFLWIIYLPPLLTDNSGQRQVLSLPGRRTIRFDTAKSFFKFWYFFMFLSGLRNRFCCETLSSLVPACRPVSQNVTCSVILLPILYKMMAE